jgi:hypothetical protein
MPPRNFRHMKKQKEDARKAKQLEKEQRRRSRVLGGEADANGSESAESPTAPTGAEVTPTE